MRVLSTLIFSQSNICKSLCYFCFPKETKKHQDFALTQLSHSSSSLCYCSTQLLAQKLAPILPPTVSCRPAALVGKLFISLFPFISLTFFFSLKKLCSVWCHGDERDAIMRTVPRLQHVEFGMGTGEERMWNSDRINWMTAHVYRICDEYR